MARVPYSQGLVQKGLLQSPSTEPPHSSESEWAVPAHFSISSVQSLSCVRLFVTPWTAAHQASLSMTNSWSPPKPMSNRLILCRPLLLLPSIFPGIRVFFTLTWNPKFCLTGLGQAVEWLNYITKYIIARPWQHVLSLLLEATQDILSVFHHCMHLFVFSELARASDDKCMPQYGCHIIVGTEVLPSFHGCSVSPSWIWVVSRDCLVALTLH